MGRGRWVAWLAAAGAVMASCGSSAGPSTKSLDSTERPGDDEVAVCEQFDDDIAGTDRTVRQIDDERGATGEQLADLVATFADATDTAIGQLNDGEVLLELERLDVHLQTVEEVDWSDQIEMIQNSKPFYDGLAEHTAELDELCAAAGARVNIVPFAPTSTDNARPATTAPATTTTAAPADPWEAAFAPLGMPTPGLAEQAAFATMCSAPLLELAGALAASPDAVEVYRAGFSVACPDKVGWIDTALAPFGPGYPVVVPLSSLPPGPRGFLEGRGSGAATAVQVAPGVWTPRGLSTTPLQDALEGGFYGFCSDVAALEQRLGDDRGGACW